MFHNLRLVSLSLAILACCDTLADEPNMPSTPQQKHALLVGCTVYPYVDRLPELYGPANDVPLWRKLLTSPAPAGFSFPVANVQQLLGWPADVRQRPTRANLVQAFESLIVKAGPGVQIVIVLSGHGTQQPIPENQDPFDPKNVEPDGLDEVFLPADAKEGSPAIENGILDNEMGAWLDRMRAKGADVWIVFDCCHSGTMTRGGDDVERSRHVEPAALGIPPEHLALAATRATDAAKKLRDAGTPPAAAPERIAPPRSATERGSLVAFFAAQPFERAPELPLPEGAAQVPEHFFGLLSYTLVQTLLERRGPLSYHALSRLLAASYRERRGTRFPTPFAEGDLDREVLGARQWPIRSELILERKADELEIGAGELHGVTVDSVLAVHPPINDARDPKTVLGYVKVTIVSPTTANVMPCAFGEKPVVADLPNLSRCEIASRHFGDMRLKVFADSDQRLQAALKRLDQDVSDLVAITAREADAQWRLRLVAPAQAAEFGLPQLTEDRVLLLPGDGTATSKVSGTAPRKFFAAYRLSEERALAGELERDLPKLFKWQNLWRVSGGVSRLDGGETHGLQFETFKLKDKNDKQGERLRDGMLRTGDFVKFTLRNEGQQNLWVTVLYLDANLAIKHLYTGQIERGNSLKPFIFRMKADGDSAGQEGMLVFAIPAAEKTPRPDFAFLEQEPLRVAEAKSRSADDAPPTPFGRLLKAAAFNRGTRDMEPVVSTTPAIVSQTWILLP